MADQRQHQLFRGRLQAFHYAYGTMHGCMEQPLIDTRACCRKALFAVDAQLSTHKSTAQLHAQQTPARTRMMSCEGAAIVCRAGERGGQCCAGG